MTSNSDSTRMIYSVRRAGAIIPLVAIFLVMLMVIIAVMIDTSWVALTKTEQQLAVDEAARSALKYLVTSQSDAEGVEREKEALEVGRNVFRDHVIGGRVQKNVPVEIEFGKAFGGVGEQLSFNPNEYPINAARCMSDGRNGTLLPVSLFFANLYGAKEFTPRSQAVVASQPTDIVLCVDCSGSMSRRINSKALPSGAKSDFPAPGSRWNDMMFVLNEFLVSMRTENPFLRIGLVAFGGGGPADAEKDLSMPPAIIEQPMLEHTDWGNILLTLNGYKRLGLQGSTDITAGIRTSVELLNKTSNPRSKQFIIVLSDGEQYTPNYETDQPELAASDAAAKRIIVHTLLIGPENAAKQLQVVAAAGNGSFYGQSLSRSVLLGTFQQLMKAFPISLVQ